MILADIDAAFASKTWGAIVCLLDTINTVEDLETVRRRVYDTNPEKCNSPLFAVYEGWLKRWPNPELTEEFRNSFPYLSRKLDTPPKARVFMRGADFCDVDLTTMGSVLEDILRKHEGDCMARVTYQPYRGSQWHDALRIVYHTKLEAWTLSQLVLGNVFTGVVGTKQLFIDWGS